MRKKQTTEPIKRGVYDSYMTQQEVADALGMDRAYVGYIEQVAKEKFRKELSKRGYKMEDFIGGMA
jgi:transcriptional regulator